jgi:hypothetical protein
MILLVVGCEEVGEVWDCDPDDDEDDEEHVDDDGDEVDACRGNDGS